MRRTGRGALRRLELARLKVARRAAALIDDSPMEVVNAALLTRTRRIASLLGGFGAEVGEHATVHGPLCIHNAELGYQNLHIGRRAHVGRNVLLDLTRPVWIGEEATIAMGTTILTHSNVGDRELAAMYPRKEQETHIGRGAYVGANATILAGCNIGRRAVIGAGSVVTAPVEDGAVALGIPARVVGTTERNSDELARRSGDATSSPSN